MPIRKVNSRAIGANVIVAEDVAANAITTAEIANAAVTPAKLALTNAFDFTGTLKASGGFLEDYVAATLSGSTLVLNCATSNNFYYTLGSNITSVSVTGAPANNTAFYFTLKVIQPASGTLYSINWPNSGSNIFKWAGGTSSAPTITSTNGAHDLFGFYTHDQGANIYSFKLGQDLKT